jgi:hypothetical protein
VLLRLSGPAGRLPGPGLLGVVLVARVVHGGRGRAGAAPRRGRPGAMMDDGTDRAAQPPRGGAGTGTEEVTVGTTTDRATRARLDERYGRTRPPGARSPLARRRLLVTLGVLALVAALAWAAWAGSGLAAQQRVSSQVIGFSEPTDSAVTLTFQVTKDPEDTVRCDVRAMAEDFTTVGWRTVELGPADEDVVARQVEIRTQQRAVSAEVMGCEAVGG